MFEFLVLGVIAFLAGVLLGSTINQKRWLDASDEYIPLYTDGKAFHVIKKGDAVKLNHVNRWEKGNEN